MYFCKQLDGMSGYYQIAIEYEIETEFTWVLKNLGDRVFWGKKLAEKVNCNISAFLMLCGVLFFY